MIALFQEDASKPDFTNLPRNYFTGTTRQVPRRQNVKFPVEIGNTKLSEVYAALAAKAIPILQFRDRSNPIRRVRSYSLYRTSELMDSEINIQGDYMSEILVDKLLSPTLKRTLSRRGFVRNLGFAGAAAAGTGLLAGCGSSMTVKAASTPDNTSGDTAQQIFTAALIAEDLATTFYFNGLNSGSVTSGLQPGDISYLQAALNEEIDHANLLRTQLSSSDSTTDPVQMFLFPAGAFTSLTGFLSTLDALENAFIGAYLAAVKEFAQMAADTKSGALTQTSVAGPVYTSVQLEYFAEISASIMGVECEHRALGRDIGNSSPADNECFEMQDTITTVYNGTTSAVAALGPFVTNGNISLQIALAGATSIIGSGTCSGTAPTT